MSERRVTLVTGASQGIGRELAVAFGTQGDRVVLAARNIDGLEETAAMIRQAGGRPVVVATDVVDVESVAAMASTVSRELGKADVVICNSGIGGPSGLLWELDYDAWLQTFAVNVHGVFLVARAMLPLMVTQGSGSVIITGSISGKRPLFGRSAYAATKMALVGLTRTLALEGGPHGIRVNLISPGFVEGPRIEWVIEAQARERDMSKDAVRAEMIAQAALNRLTRAKDVADAAVFLASDAAHAITGADLNVNSGVVMY